MRSLIVSGWRSHLAETGNSEEHRVHFNIGGHMHTPNPETQLPPPGRLRRSYSDEFKSQVVKACHEPGVSTAAVALANGLNANLLRRWVVEATQRNEPWESKTPTTLSPVHTQAAFMPVRLQSVPPVPTTTQAVNGYQYERKSGDKGIRRGFVFARQVVLEGARRASANTTWRAALMNWVL